MNPNNFSNHADSAMDLPTLTYLLWKQTPGRRIKKAKPRTSEPYQKGSARDPVKVTNVLADLNQNWGWQKEIDTANIIFDWKNIVGEKIASRTEVQAVENGVIIVECSSTAWATELRRIRADIITKIVKTYPNSGVAEMRFLVPGVPSWSHGRRSVKGKGPRDTYK